MLSHGHYDHTGGVPAMLEVVPKARVYLHPAAFENKFSRNHAGPARKIGMSDCVAQAIRHRTGGFIETTARTEIMDGVFATGEIPRANAYEDTGGAFFLDAESTRPDPLVDDQALVINLGRSVVLLLGCAHSGVVNTLQHEDPEIHNTVLPHVFATDDAGGVSCTLVRSLQGLGRQISQSGHVIRIRDFGVLRLAEIHISPRKRSLSMLQFQLGSTPAGAGQAGDTEGNGSGN